MTYIEVPLCAAMLILGLVIGMVFAATVSWLWVWEMREANARMHSELENREEDLA